MKYVLSLLLTLSVAFTAAQQQEIVLVGTMHQVPKIIKNSYKPLFRKSLAYQPDAIFVETAMPGDSLSWEYLKEGYSQNLQQFFKYSAKVRKEFDFDADSLNLWLSKDFEELTPGEFEKIKLSFAYQRDYPNYHYYRYVRKYFPDGHAKPKRHESYDLTRKLALRLRHKKVYAADDQRTNGQFHDHWYACQIAVDSTSIKKKERKIIRKLVLREVVPSALGRNGIVNNKLKHLQLLDSLSGLKFTDQNNSDCAAAVDYFNQRNRRFAHNLGTQIEANNFAKSILFVGASHIVGLKKELNRQFPDIKVVLFDEL